MTMIHGTFDDAYDSVLVRPKPGQSFTFTPPLPPVDTLIQGRTERTYPIQPVIDPLVARLVPREE